MVIKCENEGKMLAVLAKLSAETDYLWASGHKPDEYKVCSVSFPVWIIVGEDSKLTWTTHFSDIPFDYTELTDDEFLFFNATNIKDDPVNHPSHYTQGKVECIDAMEQVFGIEAVKHFCLLNWFKYNFRHELKNGQEDMDKASWYFEKYRELLNR